MPPEKSRRQPDDGPWSLTEKALGATAGGLALMVAVLRTMPGMSFSANLGLAGVAGAAILLGLSRLGRRLPPAKKILKGLWCLTAAGAVVLGALYAQVLAWEGRDGSAQGADVMIVLGAGVNGTVPSAALQSRIDAAAAYLLRHGETLAVLSGGQGPGEGISEALAIQRALTARGIAQERLVLEERSTNTRENLENSLELLSAAGVTPRRVALVTNGFHMARARLLLGRLTAAEIVSVPAHLPWWWLNVNYRLRECFALVKDRFWQKGT